MPQMSHDPCDGLLPPAPLHPPLPTLQSGAPGLGAADERRLNHSDRNEPYFTTHCWPPLCSPLLLNLYFGFRTSAETPGKENEPLIGGDVSTLSPYGARNSTELLSNLHNMLGI